MVLPICFLVKNCTELSSLRNIILHYLQTNQSECGDECSTAIKNKKGVGRHHLSIKPTKRVVDFMFELNCLLIWSSAFKKQNKDDRSHNPGRKGLKIVNVGY